MPGVSVEITLPTGSVANNITTGYGIQKVADAALNSLADGSTLSGLTYENATGATNAKVEIILQSITPGVGANIQLDNGTDYYEMAIDTTTSAKKLEFIDIPATFLSSFSIINNTGVVLASGGNTCIIYPL
jgi:hypothetical protein